MHATSINERSQESLEVWSINYRPIALSQDAAVSSVTGAPSMFLLTLPKEKKKHHQYKIYLFLYS
jgi:hypothetical protein